MRIADLVKDAVEELKEWMIFHPDEDPYDQGLIYEIADSQTPVYTSTALELATNDLWLMYEEPESPAFDGKPNAINVLTGVIYDHILDALHDYYNEHKDDFIEEEDDDPE
jgi:hypothetical protein